MSPMFRLLLVGRGGRAGGFVPRDGDPHPDALTIEAAIIGLRRFREKEISGSCGLADDVAGLEVDELAAVHHALRNIVDLVLVHARAGSRPYAGEEQPSVEPVLTDNGRPSVMVPALIDAGGVMYETCVATRALRSGLYAPGAFCPLRYEPDPQSIVRDRADYAVWRAALRLLAEELHDKLETIAILSPSAPEHPWLGERDSGKPTILQDLSAVYTRQEAERAAAERRQAKRRSRPAKSGPARRNPEPSRGVAKA